VAAVPARAAEIGAASMLGIQLWVEGDNLAALNLYSRRVDTLDDDSEQIGLLFASHAAVAFASVQDMNHMRTALATRDLIGQAKGILMERYQVTGDQAFQMLGQGQQRQQPGPAVGRREPSLHRHIEPAILPSRRRPS